MKNILFVCTDNSSVSQMAQAFAIIYGKNKVRAYSAGAQSIRSINPLAVTLMKEHNYNLSIHEPRTLQQIPFIEYEYAITMGCPKTCLFIVAKNREDWDIAIAEEMNITQLKKLRNLIEQKVKTLIEQIALMYLIASPLLMENTELLLS